MMIPKAAPTSHPRRTALDYAVLFRGGPYVLAVSRIYLLLILQPLLCATFAKRSQD